MESILSVIQNFKESRITYPYIFGNSEETGKRREKKRKEKGTQKVMQGLWRRTIKSANCEKKDYLFKTRGGRSEPRSQRGNEEDDEQLLLPRRNSS